MINIIQHGSDGLGHQLHGLFSCLILHNVGNYRFSGYDFIKKPFKFQHLTPIEEQQCKLYLSEVVKLFIQKYDINDRKFNGYIHSHEVYNIPEKSDENILYGLDNAYYFDKINLSSIEKAIHNKNICDMAPLFINKYLPSSRLPDKNIVIHIRMGDALTTGRGESINNYNNMLMKLIDILINKYIDYEYYFHTDGNIEFILDKLKDKNVKYNLSEKNTPILNVISDLIHSKILICGNSGLSKVCSFLGNKELVVINDDNKHSMPTITRKISDYISSMVY
jgi:hypothetical protein